MYRNLHFKIILILVIFTVTLMSVVGMVFVGSSFRFYSNAFFTEMETAFSPESALLPELKKAMAEEEYPERQYEILRTYSGLLGIDSYRDFCVLDSNGEYLYGSDASLADTLDKTPNIISAMSGETGTSHRLLSSYIDYALCLNENGRESIIYVIDSQEDVRSLSEMIFQITVQALFFGMLVAILLSFFLARAIADPIRRLTFGAQRISEGEFSDSVEIKSNDEIGTLSETFNNMKDVLKNTLDEISGERRKFETLFLYLNDAVLTFDSVGHLMHINKMAKQLFEADMDGKEPLTFTALIRILKIDYKAVSEEYREKNTYSIHDVIYKDKALDIMLAEFRYMDKNTESRGVMCVIHDVTGRYELDKSRREFVADVSHELRTPLTSIKGAVETVKEYPQLPAEMRDNFLQMAVDECDRMTRIVGDLLVLSRLDNKRTAWKIETFSAEDFMARLHDIMAVPAQEKNQSLLFRCDPGIPALTADREKISQVLINIISNSVKYTAEGGEIHVSAKPDKEGVLFHIVDNGMGIPEEDLPRLFERFYRVEKARTSDAGGTGLGLAIAKEIVDAHGGSVWVESKVGVGTSTWVYLPAECKLPSEKPKES